MNEALIIIPAVLVGGPLIWIFVCHIIALVSGWKRLAKHYPAVKPPRGRCHLMESGFIGIASYKGCLTIYTSEEGLYFKLWSLFRMAHPPLFVPWSSIHNRVEKQYFWRKAMEFEVGHPPVGRMTLSPHLFNDAPRLEVE